MSQTTLFPAAPSGNQQKGAESMSLDTSQPTPTPEQAETPIQENQSYGTLEDAMEALDGVELGNINQSGEDTTEPDQLETEAETEDETDELEEEETSEEVEEEGEDQDEDIEPLDYDPTRKVTLEDGTEASLEELVNGNLRQADYTRKTEALAEERRALDNVKAEVTVKSEEINRTYEGLIEFLQGIVPPEPSLELLGVDQLSWLLVGG